MNMNQLFHLTSGVSNVLLFGSWFSNQTGPGPTLSYSQLNLRHKAIVTIALIAMALAVSQFLVTSAYGQTPDQSGESSGTHQPPDEGPEPKPETVAETLDGSGGNSDFIPQASDTVSPRFVSAKSDGRSVVITFSEDIFYSPLVRYVQEKYDVQIDRFVRATFQVTFDGTPVVLADGANISGNELTVVLVQAHDSQQEIKISYNNIFVRDSGGIFVDAAGNFVPQFSTMAVRNDSESTYPDRPAGPVLSPSEITISEGGTATYTVKLPSQPTETKTVRARSYHIVSTDSTQLTFTTENWNTPQTVTVTAREDNDSFNAWAIISHDIQPSSFPAPFLHYVDVLVEDQDTPLTVSGSESASYQENGTSAVGTYSVTGSGGSSISWRLYGPDKGDFSINRSGALRFKSSPDFENPADSNRDNVYVVTIEASDSSSTGVMLDVQISVTDDAELPSTDATLSALTLSGVNVGTFAPETTSYTADVAYSVTQTTVTPTVNDSGASYVIKIGGTTDADGTVPLAVGSNVITVEVTAEDDSTTSTYTVTVTRAAASADATLSALTLSGIDFGTFAPGTTSYTADVAYGVSQTTVTPTVNDSGASYVIKIGDTTDADGTVPLAVGSNVITVEVTAEDDSTTGKYTVTVTRAAASTDATLSALTLSGIDFGTFAPGTTTYTADVANSVSETTVSPTANDSGASYVIKIGGTADADGTVPLAVGSNVITVEVTAEDGQTVEIYKVTVSRAEPPSTDATLKSLTLSGVNFGTFVPATTTYTADVANSVSQTTVTAVVSDSGASYVIKLGGTADTDDTVALAVGSNVISIEVTAEDGQTTRTYTVTVTREEPTTPKQPSSDASLRSLSLSGVNFGKFVPATTTYTADVANSVSQTTVTAVVSDSRATHVVRLGGVTDSDGVISLAVGSNVITVEVTAEDGQTTRTYTVTVTREEPTTPKQPSSDASLRSLSLSGVNFGKFVPATTTYTADVANSVSQTTVTAVVSDSRATHVVRLGGVTDSDGVISLAVGSNIITVEVTAEDGKTTRTYTVTVTREEPTTPKQPSSDASLRSLSLSGVNFGKFVPVTTTYTADVANSVSQTTVTAVVSDSRATHVVRLGGVTDSDGVISLAVGSNIITVEVTAEDGKTTRTYTVTVTREEPTTPEQPSSDASLRSLSLSGVNFGTFVPATTTYTADVANTVIQTTVTPTVNHPGATYQISLGDVVDVDGTVALAVGRNIIRVRVTAQDGNATRTYTVSVTRAVPLSDDATLRSLTLSGIDIGTFDSTTRSYRAQVANSVTQTTVTPTVSKTEATYIIKLDGVTDTDGALSLSVGTNVITIEVTAQDGATTSTYTVTVTRDPPDEPSLSSDATLSALSLSEIDFGIFDPATTDYTADVANDVSQTTVTATLNHSGANYVIKLEGAEVEGGAVSLEVGQNAVTIEVTAEDGESTLTYTVTITREEHHLLTGELASDDPPLNLHFSGYGEDEVSLAWEIPHNRGITGYVLERYDHDGSEFALSDWSVSRSVTGGDNVTEVSTSLNADSLYRYDLALTSDDGTTVLEKSVEIRTLTAGATPLSSDGTLSALSVSGLQLSLEFLPSTYRYSADVENDLGQVAVTAAPRHSTASYEIRLGGAEEDDEILELAPGRNVITVHVTAEDGVTTGIYTVVVNRAKSPESLSSDASLRWLSLSGIDFGIFDRDVTSYAAEVANDLVLTTVTPVMNDVEATRVIKLGGVEVADGEVSLSVGENVITVEVTAEDGVATETYTVTATRAEVLVPEPADTCVQHVESDGAIEASWDDTCLSEKDAPGGDGDRYAHFYTFTLDEAAEVTIELESDEDTYLYLLNGHGTDGDTLHENDDIAAGGLNLNSSLSVTLRPGNYTIEATTYAAGQKGDFTLTVNGLPVESESPPTPEPPEDECLGTVSGSGAVSGIWSSDCDSEVRSGSYAGYYTFTLTESADVTITAESDVDTWLFLREGDGRDGTEIADNDDHAAESDCTAELERTTDSCIVESLDAGTYTIEVTTYTAGETGTFTLTVSGLPAAVTPTPAPDPSITITFGDLNWSSVTLQNRIAQYIAEKGYGYSTKVESGATLPLFQALRVGSIDVLMEVWLPSQEQDWEAASAEGTVSSPGRSLGADWQSAFVIPKYLQEQYPDLDNVEDLKEEQYRSLFATDETAGKARLMSCVVGWQCEGVNAKQIEGYGLSDHVHIVNPASGEDLNADLTEAYENEEPWLGYQWGTNDPALLLELVRLEEPAYSDECWSTTMACAYEDATVLIAVRSGLPESADDFVEVLTEWDFNVEGNFKPVFRWLSENPDANLEDAALWWLRENSDVWSEWVTSDASAAIQSALDSREIPEGWPQEPNITPEPTPQPPADECVSVVSGNGAITGSWSSECDSESRNGSYASYYNFSLTESAEVTITAESDVDTWLFLREDAGRDGTEVTNNDDNASESDCTAEFERSTDSCIVKSLDAGSYTIELTTYTAGETGEFTLTIGGLPAAVVSGSSTDRAALVALYNATDGANWTDKANWLSDEPLGEWHGVTADDDGRVTEVRLSENNLAGSIPSELGRISSLTILHLDDNQLSGQIPEELGNLSNLTEMKLNRNELSGGIPAELGSVANLEELALGGNQLSGEIPSELGNLSNLTGLYLWGNELSGQIPEELGNLANLERVFLDGNQLMGEIPSELGSLANLERLGLGGNELSGWIPSELGSLANLQYLGLTRNQLNGEIPSELGSLADLDELALGGNKLSGEIPPDLGNLSNMTELYLWGNELSGEIPAELARLSSLTVLHLGGNQLSEQMPEELGSLSNLTEMNLSNNELSGEIPAELGNLSDLTELYLQENSFSGAIPSELGRLTNLTVLNAWENHLNGEIPSALGSLSNLEVLSLSRNQLTGGMPSDLGNLFNLTILDLTRNTVSGEIPDELGRLNSLEILALGGNQLSGEIPAELGNLLSLTELWAWGNQLSGGIPSELGSLTNLQYLDLTQNQLSGEIPDELGQLAGLEFLALGHNQLSGEIPSELGGLSNLGQLYLYDNRLNGEIPAELLTIPGLRFMALYGNQLSGSVPEHPEERNILTTIYNSTGGADWNENENWGSVEPVFAWDRVVIDTSGHVTALWLNGNELSSQIPSELGGLTSLATLYLNGNQLSGEIPAELGNLENLEELYLRDNQLSGCIPAGLQEVPWNDLYDLGLEFCSDEN